MTEMTPLIATLRRAGLLLESSSADLDSKPASPVPWFVQVLHAFTGWVASLFFLLLLGSVFHRLFSTPLALFGIGVVLIALAYGVLRAPSETLFLEHGALALSLAGQALIGFALFQWNGNMYAPTYAFRWLALAGVEGVLAIVIPQHLHRVLSTWVAALALIVGAGLLGLTAIAVPSVFALAVWVWLHEFRPPNTIALKQAAGYGLSLALFLGIGDDFRMGFLSHSTSHLHFGLDHPAVVAFFNSAVMFFAASFLARRLKRRTTHPLFALLIPLLPIAILSVWMHGLPIALILLMVGFARGNRLLQGMSLAALLWTVGRFYYTLETTLLLKSALLIAAGVVLLVGYGVLKYREGAHDAS